MVVGLLGGSQSQSFETVVPQELHANGTTLSVSAQKMSEGGQLTVEFWRKGEKVGESSTSAAYGVVTLAK